MNKDLDKYYHEDASDSEDHSDRENWSESDWSESDDELEEWLDKMEEEGWNYRQAQKQFDDFFEDKNPAQMDK